MCRKCLNVCVSYSRAGRRELFQHVGDKDLQKSLSEELLTHRAAIIVIFLLGGDKKQKNETLK